MNEDILALSARLGEICRARGITITTAESCTGGGVGCAITAVSGSSEYFETGFITYSNAAKTQQLGVSASELAEHGAVSAVVVKAMVAGACRASGAHYAVALSGVAGPGGGSAEKPVGTVWIGFGSPNASDALCYRFDGDRHAVRTEAVEQALAGLIERLSGVPDPNDSSIL
ncbi:CinA family protein [Larsenimonas salina]|uniref:CinA family protein n=1 Tax=Larsenimonas salina TaxID=1295565 RepID=UPI0020743797|nr:nicotinamide-nucleotide amidohydrolase family protein [Larsenimonas salina]MCM5705377.1 nicotinamide-nucleotide amidohydrolase family protein [Larsenimonas salina]